MRVQITWIAVALGVFFSGCDGVTAATDAGMDDARVRMDGSLPPSEYEHYLAGTVAAFGSLEPLEGVRACILEHPELPCAVSDSAGWIELGPIPRRQRVRVEFTHPDLMRQLFLWEATQISRQDMTFPQVTADFFDALAAERGGEIDPTRGLIAGYIATADSLFSGLEGAEIALDGETGALIPVASYAPPFSTSDSTTPATGFFAFTDVEPGDHTLDVIAPGHVCVEGTRWSRGINELDVPIEPNTLTTMYLICPERSLTPVDEPCFDGGRNRYAVCDGRAPGCLVREAGGSAVCTEDVGPCPDQANTCVGDILVRGCRNLQPFGVDCFALGGRCDAEANACVDVLPGSACSVDAQCAEGSQCNRVPSDDPLLPEGQHAVCEPGLDCAGYFACNLDCADSECVQGCYQRVLDYARPTVDLTYECFAETDCAPSLASCQQACPTEWTLCVGE